MLSAYLWLLLCYAQHAKSSLLQDYEEISISLLSPQVDIMSLALPYSVETDERSGCLCRSTENRVVTVCFGNFECKMTPKLKLGNSDELILRTTFIPEILVGELDAYYNLKILRIEGNSRLLNLQPGLFRNLTNLEQLSISYNTQLLSIHENTFDGLTRLHNLTLVNNGFKKLSALTPALRPSILPSLRALDLSENVFGSIAEKDFDPMEGSLLHKLDINLCRLDYIHPYSMVKLKTLVELHMGENDLNVQNIIHFLVKMQQNGINLLYLDLSSLGFRRRPPPELMRVIANTTIRRLSLEYNQFEIIDDMDFPPMPNLEILDLRRILAMSISENVFNPTKFPKLRILLLSGNNLPGINLKHISYPQLLLLDLSSNKGTETRPIYYEIDRGVFIDCKQLRFLNLAYNRIKHIFNHTFIGLENLRILNLQNSTIFHIGDGTFKPLKRLELLNLNNNPLTANQNLTSAKFEGLNELRVFVMKNCGIKKFNDDDNIFEMTPKLTHLILSNNQLFYITPTTLKPLKLLKVLDLSDNLFVSWWQPLFLSSGIQPKKVYFMNNKITHFTLSMIEDINFLLEHTGNFTVEIDLADNLFVCDCNSMYKTFMWLQVNGSVILKHYFAKSKILCSSPDIWENRRVADYIASIKSLRCLVYQNISNIMLLVWTAPSLVTIALLIFIVVVLYRYRMYIRYWLFLAKVALGRKFIRKSLKASNSAPKGYRFDAFVSYCNDDRDFVLEMISQLESNPPYLKLCIYERDFEIGSFISESILGSINESRYIILVISNGFAKSQWCRWETHLAEYHRLFIEDGSPYDPLVLVKVGDVENKYLTTTLKYLMKTKIYHSWDERNPDAFFDKLRNILIKNK